MTALGLSFWDLITFISTNVFETFTIKGTYHSALAWDWPWVWLSMCCCCWLWWGRRNCPKSFVAGRRSEFPGLRGTSLRLETRTPPEKSQVWPPLPPPPLHPGPPPPSTPHQPEARECKDRLQVDSSPCKRWIYHWPARRKSNEWLKSISKGWQGFRLLFGA